MDATPGPGEAEVWNPTTAYQSGQYQPIGRYCPRCGRHDRMVSYGAQESCIHCGATWQADADEIEVYIAALQPEGPAPKPSPTSFAVSVADGPAVEPCPEPAERSGWFDHGHQATTSPGLESPDASDTRDTLPDRTTITDAGMNGGRTPGAAG